jgi:hypothetical protein
MSHIFEGNDESIKQVETSLINLGFDYDFVVKLVAQYQFTDLNHALEYAVKGQSGWIHYFLPSETDPDLCEFCGEPVTEHFD